MSRLCSQFAQCLNRRKGSYTYPVGRSRTVGVESVLHIGRSVNLCMGKSSNLLKAIVKNDNVMQRTRDCG